MGQTSNNNNYMPVIFPIMILVMIPVIILVMIHIRMTVMTSFMYSGPIYYLFLFRIYVVLVICLDSLDLHIQIPKLGSKWSCPL